MIKFFYCIPFVHRCKQFFISTDEKKRIIKECQKIKKEGLSWKEFLEKSSQNYLLGDDLNLDSWYIGWSKISVVWNLINLGYADGYYTNIERELVDFLCEYWEIENSLYREMMDTADTILALENYKKWVDKILPESEIKQAKIKKIQRDIKDVQKSIELTITEID